MVASMVVKMVVPKVVKMVVKMAEEMAGMMVVKKEQTMVEMKVAQMAGVKAYPWVVL
jgi:TPP-dependent indolepyruvate ferredoxin oxidoreductase alpha subunit